MLARSRPDPAPAPAPLQDAPLRDTPWTLTGTGRAVDLLAPDPHTIDLDVDVAEALARIPRFTGHIRSGPYSVAQHSVVGADLLARESEALAAAFLLHDAHEAYLGDIATPVAYALAQAARGASIRLVTTAGCPDAGDSLLIGLASLKEGLDRAIHAAAGLAWPPPPAIRARVKALDAMMLVAEAKRLLPPPPRERGFPAAAPLRLGDKLVPWPWPVAADAFRERLDRYCPKRARRPV